ncbi:MAG: membrane protein insertion efficiency factor YidD [Oscillospiraceae bacterium]|nr:membrane protein insertion efficiency factor YidD [Oscillospiraceae bacterium]
MNQDDYKQVLKDYHKQREIAAYQEKRNLTIPRTTYSILVILFAAFVLSVVGIPFLVFRFTNLPVFAKAIAISLIVIVFSDFAFRYLGIKTIECYQHYAKEEIRRRCICVPSCSEYAILCLKKYELVHALIKIHHRLYVTCYGSDYIIDWPS